MTCITASTSSTKIPHAGQQQHHPCCVEGGGKSSYYCNLHPDLERLLLDSHQNVYLTMLDISAPLYDNKEGHRMLLDQGMAECIVKFLQKTPRFCKLQIDVAWQTPGALRVLGDFLKNHNNIQEHCPISSLSFKQEQQQQQQQQPTQQQQQKHGKNRCPQQSFSWVEKKMAEVLDTNESVEEISWTHFDFDRDAAVAAGAGFRGVCAHQNLRRLKTLQLQECYFGSNVSCFLAADGGLLLRPQLQNLTLFRCQFLEDSVGAQIISTVAKSCPLLNRLNLSWNTGLGNKTLCSLTKLLQCPSSRLSSLSLNQNKGLFEDPTLEDAFYYALCYANDSVLNLQITTGNEDKDNGAARVLQLHSCRLRNRVSARVRHTLDTTTTAPTLSLWGPALGRLARPDPKTGSCFEGVSGLFLAVSALSTKLSEQVVSNIHSAR